MLQSNKILSLSIAAGIAFSKISISANEEINIENSTEVVQNIDNIPTFKKQTQAKIKFSNGLKKVNNYFNTCLPICVSEMEDDAEGIISDLVDQGAQDIEQKIQNKNSLINPSPYINIAIKRGVQFIGSAFTALKKTNEKIAAQDDEADNSKNPQNAQFKKLIKSANISKKNRDK